MKALPPEGHSAQPHWHGCHHPARVTAGSAVSSCLWSASTTASSELSLSLLCCDKATELTGPGSRCHVCPASWGCLGFQGLSSSQTHPVWNLATNEWPCKAPFLSLCSAACTLRIPMVAGASCPSWGGLNHDACTAPDRGLSPG